MIDADFPFLVTPISPYSLSVSDYSVHSVIYNALLYITLLCSGTPSLSFRFRLVFHRVLKPGMYYTFPCCPPWLTSMVE